MLNTKKTNKVNKQEDISILVEKEDQLKVTKSIYDIVNSEELDLLYKKNAHLLTRLSNTGKENTLLYTKLSSIRKEHLHLDVKNTVLKGKVTDLKEQISLFVKQHRSFHQQSKKLQKEMVFLQNTPVSEEDLTATNLELVTKNSKLLEKKERVYREQIQNLQTLSKKIEEQKLEEINVLNREHKKNIYLLERKIQNLCQSLGEEQEQKVREKFLSKNQEIKQLKSINKDLNTKWQANQIELNKQNKENELLCETKEIISEQINTFKSKLDTKVQEMGLKNKDIKIFQTQIRALEKNQEKQELLKKESQDQQKNYQLKLQDLSGKLEEKSKEHSLNLKNLQRLQKQNLKVEKKEQNLYQSERQMREEKLVLLRDRKEIKNYKNQIQALENIEQDLSSFKKQNFQLIKEKEQMKSKFIQELECSNKERDFLKFQAENLKKGLSALKTGFDQTLISFQSKYRKLYQNNKQEQEAFHKQANRVKILKEDLLKSKDQFVKEKEEIKNVLVRQTDKKISEIYKKLQASTDHNQDLVRQVEQLKVQARDIFSRETCQLQEEIQTLRLNKDKQDNLIKQSHTKEIESLKLEYENRIKNMENAYKNKLQHIRTEMENDLCSEKKRFEIFKDMKMKEMKEIQENLYLLQEESYKLKSEKNILGKSLDDTNQGLKKHIKTHAKLEEQNGSLKILWQELQTENETQTQQIRSLQKLNRTLSLSLNEKQREGERKIVLEKQGVSKIFIKKEEEKNTEELKINHVLADIHFE